ncbi:MAG: porphobilinogen synthase [Candidatus Cloacimonadota bacterium]|nr:MAG: porphobilinogen synthase [Candidatus Cloacimonadota bacterium]
MFPQVRLRRLRENHILRESITENKLSINDLILPLFIHEEKGTHEILSMPSHYRLDIETMLKDVEKLIKGGVKKFILFGIPKEKDALASGASAIDGIVQQAIIALKKNFGNNIYVLADLCFCEYTSHGHCGVLENSVVLNDETLNMSQKLALSYADAGVDMIAPSGMMDGIVSSLRSALDVNNYSSIPIMGYSAKYSSAFYGPFRDAAGSAPESGNRKGYQMNPANRLEAMREVDLDVAEGVDILMVKPALSYLDIIRDIKNKYDLPLACYNVSGEYSIIKAAAQKGWIDEQAVALESLLSMKRAGADLILSYWARDFVSWGITE